MLKTIDFENAAKVISEQTAQRKTCLYESAINFRESDLYRILKVKAKKLAENVETVAAKMVEKQCLNEGIQSNQVLENVDVHKLMVQMVLDELAGEEKSLDVVKESINLDEVKGTIKLG